MVFRAIFLKNSGQFYLYSFCIGALRPKKAIDLKFILILPP